MVFLNFLPGSELDGPKVPNGFGLISTHYSTVHFDCSSPVHDVGMLETVMTNV